MGDTEPRTLVTRRVVFYFLADLEMLAAAPLAWYLPSSSVALVVAVVILLAMNASVLTTIPVRTWSLLLQVSNLAVGAIFLRVAFAPGSHSWEAWAMTIGAFYLGLFGLGFFHLGDRVLRQCLAAQQLALASTLIFWLVIQHYRPVFEATGIISTEDFRVCLSFLFLAPLALAAITFFAGLSSWRGWTTALAGVCAGQWGIGFIELGAELDYQLVVVGFILGIAFLGLLIVAVVSGRRSTIEGAS